MNADPSYQPLLARRGPAPVRPLFLAAPGVANAQSAYFSFSRYLAWSDQPIYVLEKDNALDIAQLARRNAGVLRYTQSMLKLTDVLRPDTSRRTANGDAKLGRCGEILHVSLLTGLRCFGSHVSWRPLVMQHCCVMQRM